MKSRRDGGREGETETEITNKFITIGSTQETGPVLFTVFTAHGYLILFPSIFSVFPGSPTMSSPLFPLVEALQTQTEFSKVDKIHPSGEESLLFSYLQFSSWSCQLCRPLPHLPGGSPLSFYRLSVAVFMESQASSRTSC